jgi:predicted nucleic acid-binding protein
VDHAGEGDPARRSHWRRKGKLHAAISCWQGVRCNATDKQIAAIAMLHDLTVVTRNTDDFAGCGVQ